MINDNNEEPVDLGLQRLYAHMTDDQVREAQRNLRRYAAVVLRIYERLKAEGKDWPR
jgi:CII-binding regulator of phage lambda lysogenization HflD